MSRRRRTEERETKRETSGFKPRVVTARTPNQKQYISTIRSCDITLCHGPAGSGKTHLAVGLGVNYLRENLVERIVLTRPAIDSGASLGYLPGSMEEKIGPYLTPLFDELGYFAEAKTAKAWMEHKILEICPLSLMRGRTFNQSYIILDEAQNATMPELRMCLTRIGQNAKMVIVGDLLQSDLEPMLQGGFKRCIRLLEGLEGIGVCSLDDNDIVRNRLIAEIERRLRGV